MSHCYGISNMLIKFIEFYERFSIDIDSINLYTDIDEL